LIIIDAIKMPSLVGEPSELCGWAI
jgi:hypothetical protein